MQNEKEESSATKSFYMEKVILFLIYRPILMSKLNSWFLNLKIKTDYQW
jgi:hypothetical protein